jgi:hypothetical protein
MKSLKLFPMRIVFRFQRGINGGGDFLPEEFLHPWGRFPMDQKEFTRSEEGVLERDIDTDFI